MAERTQRRVTGNGPPVENGERAETFEQAFTKLEDTVRKLEAGQLTLDESTSLYEEGMRLARRCSELLSRAELKITRLQSQFAEQMSLVHDMAEQADEETEEDGEDDD